VLAESFTRCGLAVERQTPVPILFDGIAINEGFRADLLLEGRLLIELKSVERIAPVHGKQVLTYLRLLALPLGLLMNFGAATFREGVKRMRTITINRGARRRRMGSMAFAGSGEGLEQVERRPAEPAAPRDRAEYMLSKTLGCHRKRALVAAMVAEGVSRDDVAELVSAAVATGDEMLCRRFELLVERGEHLPRRALATHRQATIVTKPVLGLGGLVPQFNEFL
jgi:GxxExxY protein